MVKTQTQLVPAARRLVSAGKNHKAGVTVHQTGNTNRGADAQAHANLQSNGNSRAASWHWQVDDKVAIQSYRHNDRCWHAGNAVGNRERIAVEICVNSDGNYTQSLRNAAELVASILKNIDKTPSDVDQHHNYTGKNCPAQIRASQGGIGWSDFIGMVRQAFNGDTPSLPSGGSGGSSSGNSGKSVTQLAREVIDGKHGNGDARRASLGSQFAAVQAEVNRILGGGSSSSGSSSRKTPQQVAQDIANGVGGWGNDPERSRKLTAAGYNAADVQRRVNAILSGGSSSSSSRLTVDQVARQIINGQGGWGNDPERSRKLRNAGYDPATVQRRVNQLL